VTQFTANFSEAELACKCGCGMLPERDFMDRVQNLRNSLGKPMIVTSAARCPEHNSRVSRTGRTGPHTTGRAIDIGIEGAYALKLVELALAHGFTGIGVNQKGAGRFIHIDDLKFAPGRPRPWIWSYP